MPLLRRQPFVRVKPPPDLKPDEDVFHCKLTNEIFRDYEQFFERIILCNSLVWTCSVTGRPQLTYQEALESEERARKHLATFPKALQRPLLCLATMTHRSRLSELDDDIFTFTKDRYFVGEEVEVFYRNQRKNGVVLKVIPPKEKLPKKPPPPKKLPVEDSDSDVKIIEPPVMIDLTLSDSELDDGAKVENKSPMKTSPRPATAQSPRATPKSNKSSPRASPSKPLKTVESDKYSYHVQVKGEKKDAVTLKSSAVSRKKGVFTREKSKLYLKQHCEPVNGIWQVKDKYIRSFMLDDETWDDIFGGPLPVFGKTLSKKKSSKATGSTAEKFFQSKKKEKKDKEKLKKEKAEKKMLDKEAEAARRIEKLEKEQMKKKISPEEKAAIVEKIKQERLEMKLRMKEERMKKAEEERARKKEEREKEKEKQKEERRIQAEYYKEWSKLRDDMECDDLKPLPEPTPVGTQIPPEVFGDVLMLLEFFHHFETIFEAGESFPQGIDLDIVEKALMDNETNGTWFDLLRLLLTTVFGLQEEEDEEEEELEKENHGMLPGDLPEGMEEDMSDVSTKYLIQAATVAAQWPLLYQGTPLTKMPLDSYTITEILRLHFLSSGAKAGVRNAKFRYQQRGGYTSLDDAGLEFRKEQPAIIKALGTGNVFDLGPRDKMKIVHALLGQALSYAVARDIVEEGLERTRLLKIDLRQLQATEQKREREEATARWKRRMEERAKGKEEEAKRKALKLKEKEEQLAGLAGGEQQKDETADKAAEKAAAILKAEDARTSGRLMQKKMKIEEKQIEGYLDDYEKLKDIDPSKLSVRQKQLVEEKRAELSAQIKEECKIKEKEILDEIYNAQTAYAVYPIGRDRLYRRYWVFKALPGLFVEDEEDFITQDCVKPVSQKASVVQFTSEGLPMNVPVTNNPEKIASTGSDKENDSFEGKLPNGDVESGKSVLGSENINRTGMTNGAVDKLEAMDVDEKPQQMTNTNRAIDQIENRNINQVHWAFYHTVDELDQLLNNLNQRGFRESSLKVALQEQKDRIITSMQRCPSQVISCRDCKSFPSSKESQRTFMNIKSRNRNMQGSVRSNCAQEYIELNLREMLLDLEERIYHGSLGSMKMKDRGLWRDAIEQGGYLSEKISEDVTINGKVEESGAVKMETDDTASVSSSDFEDQQVVKDMSRALLQIARGVEPKYTNPPLGEDESKKKAKQKAALEAAIKTDKRLSKGGKKNVKEEEEKEEEEKDDVSVENDSKVNKTPMERWEESLSMCTGLSQIFVHLATLEGSIMWSKSALHARCRICRRKGDAEQMLLCDMCDRGHHMYCLKPPVQEIPAGDWFCPDCRPKDIRRSPRKARRKRFADSESETEEGDSDEEEEESSEEGDSDDEEADSSSNEDADSEEDDDDDDDEEEDSDDDDDDDESEEESEEEEDVPPTPAKIKLKGRAPKSAPESRRSKGTPTASAGSSRRGTPTIEGKNSRKGTPNEPKSGSRLSAGGSRPSSASKANKRKSQEMNGSIDCGPSSKKTKRNSLEPDAGKTKATSSFRSSETFQQIKNCEDILSELVKHEDAWPFLKPVSKRDAPDYFDIIKNPMDFSTIRSQLNKYHYNEPQQVIEDIRLVFSNCDKYNLPSAIEYKAGQKLSKLFEKKLKDLKLDKLKTPAKSSGSQGKTGKSAEQEEESGSRRPSRRR